MNGRLAVGFGSVVVAVALWLGVPHAQQPAMGRGFVPDEVLVKFRSGVSDFQRSNILSGRAPRLLRRFRALDLDHIRLAAGQDVQATVALLRRSSAVVFAQPNYIRRPVGTAPPNDLYWLFGFLWGIERVQAQSAWTTFTHGAADVVIADIDTGVDYTHPDLAANMWVNPGEIAGNGLDDDDNGYIDDIFGIDTANDDSDPMDDQGHGTHTAGTVAATGNNGIGVVGVAWGSKILACKFVTAEGLGTDAGAIECFNYVVALKQRGINIRVTSNSWGSLREGPADALKAAIDAAGAAGILNVFAAGNDGTNNDVSPFDPAGFDSPSIIAVAASNQSDGRVGFSNYGAASVDLAAPGDFILSTYAGDYAFASGTSMAAPHVAGAAALLVSKEPSLSVDMLKLILMQTTDPLPQWAGVVASGGRLNVSNSLTVAGGNIAPTVSLTNPTSGASIPVSTAVPLVAEASDIDGTVSRVDFTVNGVVVGTDTSSNGGVFSVSWTASLAGSYTLTATATDSDGATRTSNPVVITLTPPVGRVNVALASNGAIAVASSSLGGGYPASSTINGDRKGVAWGNGGGWADGTTGTWPDWLEVRFSGLQVIEEIDVFTVQDAYAAPVEPTSGMLFTKYGLRDFVVEYWDGSTWKGVSGANVTDNNQVWSQFHFLPVTTSRIRVFVTEGLASNSRIIEVEAYASLGLEKLPPSVIVTSPLAGATFPVSTALTLTATATDPDGTVAMVEFFANNLLVGADATAVNDEFTLLWTPVVSGSYTLVARATDNSGAARESTSVSVTLAPPPGRVNVALAANGGVVTASSAFGAGYPTTSVNNGDRKGLGWGAGGGWADGTTGTWPDWLEVQFAGPQMIEEIDLFTVQDSYAAPVEPTLGLTFTKYGIQDFVAEYWTGTSWQPIPDGIVANNTRVWRQFNFAPVTTSRIRVFITNAMASNSRVTEIEAYAVFGMQNVPPTVSLTSPASGATFVGSTPIVLQATADDSDGGVVSVDFLANNVLVGTDTTSNDGVYAFSWVPSSLGSYSLIAIATDTFGATRTSNTVTITVTPPGARINVALAANGGTAVASSVFGAGYPASSVNNGDRKGVGWGNGGGWADGTTGIWPDWLEIQFNTSRQIEEIDVFTVQDNYAAPIEPTLAMTFTRYGVRDFIVEYWTGNSWQAVPNGLVTSNTRVWRQFNFSPVTTSRIRVFINNGLASNSRLTEIEVYSTGGS